MDIVLLIGRILFGALFLGAAMGHLTQTASMAGYAAFRWRPWQLDSPASRSHSAACR